MWHHAASVRRGVLAKSIPKHGGCQGPGAAPLALAGLLAVARSVPRRLSLQGCHSDTSHQQTKVLLGEKTLCPHIAGAVPRQQTERPDETQEKPGTA